MPNPATAGTSVRYSLPGAGGARAVLLDASGRMMRSQRIDGKEGSYRLGTTDLASGVYLVRIIQGTVSTCRKLMVRRD